jgi:uncharacterized membrane protein (UPF0127 family)
VSGGSPSAAWLLRDGEVIAALEVPAGVLARSRGLLGRDSMEGAMLIRARGVHTVGMRFAIDVAWCDKSLEVLATTTLAPFRVALPRPRARFVLEARAGAFEQWNLRPGDKLERKG